MPKVKKEIYALGQDSNRKIRPWSVVAVSSDYPKKKKIKVVGTYKTEKAAYIAFQKIKERE